MGNIPSRPNCIHAAIFNTSYHQPKYVKCSQHSMCVFIIDAISSRISCTGWSVLVTTYNGDLPGVVILRRLKHARGIDHVCYSYKHHDKKLPHAKAVVLWCARIMAPCRTNAEDAIAL